ncbi:MAG: hypothetical protein RL589_88 [Actinomycetota bacterium]|jgi:hypothetical protein
MLSLDIRKILRFPREAAIYSPYLILFAFVAFPLLGLFHHDFWDGTRIAYARDSNDFSGVRFWLFSASLEGQYFQEYLVNTVGDFIGLSGLFLDHLLVIFALIVLIREVTIFSRDYLRVRTQLLVIPGIIVAVFPSLSLTVSSVLTFYITSLALGWYTSRKFSSSLGIARILAFLGIIYSFEYAVMILVCPILVLFYSLTKNTIPTKIELKSTWPVVCIFSSALGYKLVMMIFNQPDGPMLGYNAIRIPNTIDGLSQLAYATKSFSSFLLYPALTIFPLWIYAYLRYDYEFSNQASDYQPRLTRVLVVFILIASVLPYLAVGKSTSLFWLDFWSGRHSFALIPALAIFSVSVLDWLLCHLGGIPHKNVKFVVISTSLIIVTLSSILLFRVMGTKYLEQQNRLAVIETLKLKSNEIYPGAARIYVKNSEFLEMNTDEANYLMYKVKGNLATYSVFSKLDEALELPTESLDRTIDTWQLYTFPNKVCQTDITISRLSNLSNFPKIVLKPKYRVDAISSICRK